MKQAERFGRFIGRFWPVALPLLLIYLLPWSRPFGRVVGDEVVGQLQQMATGQGPQSAMPQGSEHPDDLDLQLWWAWHKVRRNYSYNYSDSPDTESAEIKRLRKKFPTEPLLVAPPLQHELGVSSWVNPWYDYGPPITDAAEVAADLKQLRAAARDGQKLEPDNAFWWVALAHIEWRSKHLDRSLLALERAAKCPRYDDHTLALTRRLVRVQTRYGDPSFFEKLAIIEDMRTTDEVKQEQTAKIWLMHAGRLRAKGDSARALRWAGATLVVGDLMQRDPNSWWSARVGAQWQREAYRVGYPPKVTGISPRGASLFAQFARANGRPDLARLTPILAAHSRQVQALAKENKGEGQYSWMIWLNSGANDLTQWVELLQALPFLLGAHALYLGVWWLSANLWLWRARGAPSTRRDRSALGLATMLSLLGLGALGLLILGASTGGGFGLPEAAGSSLVAIAFCGAPFVMAVACALFTMWRHRARFALPPRIDMELALSPWARAFLRWCLPACAACSVAFLLISWALWMAAAWRDWGTVDLLRLLPPDRQGKTGSLLWDSSGGALLAYPVLLCCMSFAIWFVRWRFTAPAALRELTHGALRWWKESLGMAVVTACWVSLLLALLVFPLFQQAETKLERFLVRGELETPRRTVAR